MLISRETALEQIEAGEAVFECYGIDEWCIRNNDQILDWVPITDDEPLVGCVECGHIVQPEPNDVGCGCHCPHCLARL